jgi:hypothetical protein
MVDFTINNTAGFDAGTKSSTSTTTDDYKATANRLELSCPPYAKDSNLKAFWAMDEGSGDPADATGVNNGTINGTVTWVGTGVWSGNCLNFDGSTGYVACGGDASLNITGDVTYCGWLYIPAPLPAISTFMTKGDSAGSTGHQYIFYSSDAGAYEMFIGDPINATLVGGTGMGTGAWHHIAFTKAGTACNIYYDGSPDGNVTKTAPSSCGDAFLIGRHSSIGRYFKGKMQCLRVYNRGLSAGDITTLYNSALLYKTSGNWNSATQTMTPAKQILNTIIDYTGVDANNYIDKIEWSVGGVVKATYDTNITSGTTKTITEADLTSGTFHDVVADFKVKIYFVGNGLGSPIISSITGNYETARANWNTTAKQLEFAANQEAYSKSIDFNNGTITQAKMTVTKTSGSFDYYLSADGGANWEAVTSGTLHSFTNTGTDLRWRIVENAASTGVVTKVKVEQYH